MENLFTKKVPLYFETEESQLVLGDSCQIGKGSGKCERILKFQKKK